MFSAVFSVLLLLSYSTTVSTLPVSTSSANSSPRPSSEYSHNDNHVHHDGLRAKFISDLFWWWDEDHDDNDGPGALTISDILWWWDDGVDELFDLPSNALSIGFRGSRKVFILENTKC